MKATEKITLIGKTLKETEKARYTALRYHHVDTGGEREWKTWLPKSQTRITLSEEKYEWIEIPVWLARKIDNEIKDFQKAFKDPREAVYFLIDNIYRE